jgi:hypothetical protein
MCSQRSSRGGRRRGKAAGGGAAALLIAEGVDGELPHDGASSQIWRPVAGELTLWDCARAPECGLVLFAVEKIGRKGVRGGKKATAGSQDSIERITLSGHMWARRDACQAAETEDETRLSSG